MAKFAGNPTFVSSPVRTLSSSPDTLTHEGAPAYTREAKGELFVTGLTTLVENTFYESKDQRLDRIVALVRQVTAEDPEWVAMFAAWLRQEAFMRSIPIVIAAEYVKAGGPQGRKVIDAVLWRADEPGEMLAYWISRYGRNIPQPVKRGVADAVRRLYNERALLKYDGKGQTWRFGDVIELVHPKPLGDWQAQLFKFALDRRRHKVEVPHISLPMIFEAMSLEAIPVEERREVLRSRPDKIEKAGFTWERLSGWLPGGMDAEAWEAVIGNMGYMALLRNLRNFDEAGISGTHANAVASILKDPEQVAKSKQFPFRFYSAWKAATELRWAPVLEEALELSTQNIPTFEGRTLVIVDVSGSMTSSFSNRGNLAPLEAAMVFGGAVYAKNRGRVDLVGAADRSGVIEWKGSILRTSDWVHHHTIGSATYLGRAVRDHYAGHDRVLLFTDGQFHDELPLLDVPVYLFNIGGYRPTPLRVGGGQAHEMAGLSDKTFTMIPLLEQERAGLWPWES